MRFLMTNMFYDSIFYIAFTSLYRIFIEKRHHEKLVFWDDESVSFCLTYWLARYEYKCQCQVSKAEL